jgi:hypothetical protein
MLCELPLMPDSFRLQTAAIMRIIKGGVRLERYISKIQSRRQFAGGTFWQPRHAVRGTRLGMLTPADVVKRMRGSMDSERFVTLATSSSAAERTTFSFQPANATDAPASAKAFAVARPMPAPAPVTSATLFSKDKFIKDSCFTSHEADSFAVLFVADLFQPVHGFAV